MLYSIKINGCDYQIHHIFSKHIEIDVCYDDGKGFRALIPFNSNKKLDFEMREQASKFKFPSEFKIAAQKFLNLRVFF